MRRSTRRLTVVMLATLGVTVPGVSSALAACPDLDVVCRVDEAVGARTSDRHDRSRRDTPVDEVVGLVIGPVDQVVDDVLGRVNELPGGGQVNPPDLGGGGDHHVGGPPPGDHTRDTQGPAALRPSGRSRPRPQALRPDGSVGRG